MCCLAKVGEVHLPDDEGRSMCGTLGGRTSSVALPTCPRCLEWVGPTGERIEDAPHAASRVPAQSGFVFGGSTGVAEIR
jgi:hypothetical protein